MWHWQGQEYYSMDQAQNPAQYRKHLSPLNQSDLKILTWIIMIAYIQLGKLSYICPNRWRVLKVCPVSY